MTDQPPPSLTADKGPTPEGVPPLPYSQLQNTEQAVARAVTKERLKLLAIGYFVSGGFGILTVSLLIVHFLMFAFMSTLPDASFDETETTGTSLEESHGEEETGPGETITEVDEGIERVNPMGMMVGILRAVAVLIGAIILIGWILGGLTIYAGVSLLQRKRKTLVYVMAAYNCLFIPWGTLIGVLTFVTLSQPSTKLEYK